MQYIDYQLIIFNLIFTETDTKAQGLLFDFYVVTRLMQIFAYWFYTIKKAAYSSFFINQLTHNLFSYQLITYEGYR